MAVTAWIEKVMIPTYKVGQPEKNPMFLEKRVYQGSSGVVYPHPVIEKIADEKEEQEYTALFLENEYLKIMILPELGGRIQRAYDKIRQRDFVYYNQVIKPALVGLAGPWISGGIEFNWPQHHRPSTFSPVDFTIRENADGSKTVWVNEVELMFRTKGMAGFTLYPGKAYLEISGRLFNRSALSQTFLWWANPAVKVNEHYQSVFPPDVYAVFDHGKRDVSDFPIATGTYYRMNYAPGTDISRYHTIPVPTSYMAIQSDYDFIGSYEHDTQAGMLHVADHHLSPGKKQWTWGNGDFGFAWDRNLTDEDGPYIELMTGVFTDNQPDFSWLQPNEGKSFEQYFMPYAGIGAVKNATKDAMLNMEWEKGAVRLRIYTTSEFPSVTIRLFCQGELQQEYKADLSPSQLFDELFQPAQLGQPEEWKAVVADQHGRELLAYQPARPEQKEVPVAATAALLPSEIEQVEDLFLNGQHLEQYRHATFNPIDYYEEGLRRSAGDVRCNNAMGLLLLRRGQFAKAVPYFRRAIDTQTKRNPNPYDGEPYYNLGLALYWLGYFNEAYDTFYKATWNDAWQHNAFLWLARIAAIRQEWSHALALVEKSLIRNFHSPSARHLKTALWRQSGQHADALQLTDASLALDPFNYGCLFEKYLLLSPDKTKAPVALQQFKDILRGALNNYLELSLDYAQAGFFTDATAILNGYLDEQENISPLVYYYLGWFALQMGRKDEAIGHFSQAAKQDPSLCFPNKLEEIIILQAAINTMPDDARALYYLGNCWYDKRQYAEAVDCWERSVQRDDTFPTVHRNLSLAYYNKLHQSEKALACMEKAFALDPGDARVLMELDQLHKISGWNFTNRLALLEDRLPLVNDRDDLYLERVTLYNNLHQFEMAKQLLATRQFHPWEGGEGKVIGQFLLCHIELAKDAIGKGNFKDAMFLLLALQQYPHHLGEGKLYGAAENDIDYLMGCAYEGLQLAEQAREKFQQATSGQSEPAQAVYYNDPQPDRIVYQALAWLKLGEPDKAEKIFQQFIRFGEMHRNDAIRIDYFAVSLPDMLVFDVNLDARNRIHCNYLVGLGQMGIGNWEKATQYLEEVLTGDPNHQGAAMYLRSFAFFKQAIGGRPVPA